LPASDGVIFAPSAPAVDMKSEASSSERLLYTAE
jgi:hypothetical protein